MLLAGDIEAEQEAQLLDHATERLPADVLFAPHHGSGTSSTYAFVRAVKPQLVLFLVGHRNRYRHPKQEVVERYTQLGITSLRTDQSGAITLEFGDTITASSYRRDAARYWR